MNIHDLNGCAPVPLAHYLKALGILRLVAEQADPTARGWWEGDRFRLATILDKTELEKFFIEKYEPTPLVAPWNGGTGFYPKDKKAKKAINCITSHKSTRFNSYRQAISHAIHAVGKRKEAPEKKEKEQFLIECFRDWRGPHRQAMAAAVVLANDGKPGYPALLGTGFNDGRLDFTSNFMGRLLRLLPETKAIPHATAELLQEAFWRSPMQGMDNKGAIGQFMPGNAGGANSLAGPDGDAFSNPWDFVLMLEGAIIFTSHATRRLGNNESSRASAPFTVNAQGGGYASASAEDESARGEQWMPLWAQPMTLAELHHIFSEGRAQLGARVTISEPLDFARAVARLGTARGIIEFQRYGYIERNGQANLAVPLGRFRVPEKIAPLLSCLDDLDRYRWHSQLHKEAKDTKDRKAPARLKQAERNLGNALFAVTQRPGNFMFWQSVLTALSDVEEVMKTGSGFKAGPVPPLRPEWVKAAADTSVEFRLALAFALQAAAFGKKDERRWPIDPVRRHWLPLDGKKPWCFATSGTGSQARLESKSDVVIFGRSGVDDAIALVKRRLVEASQSGQHRLPLTPAFRASAAPDDLAWLLSGNVDLDRTVALARALMALDGRKWAANPGLPKPNRGNTYPDDAWLAIRLSLLPWPLPDGRKIGVDSAIFRRLESGDAATAFELARRRLRAAGIGTTVQCATVSPEAARLWAAALAFPIEQATAADFVRRLDPNAK